MIGTTLSHYRILDRIGEGGMGVVYRAKDERLDRDVALKVLPAGAFADESSRKRFRGEALALSRLNHPNIETVHDFDRQDGVDFLVMEYIPGVTLDRRLAAGPLPEPEILRLGSQLAEGLAAAHAQGVVHSDLKPGNLRVTPDGRLKILDFGLARLLTSRDDGAPTVTLVGRPVLAGTPPYMAPEQFRGAPNDARVDLYMAGAVLYEMATGRRAFDQPACETLLRAILHGDSPAPRSLNPVISIELERVILKVLNTDPRSRHQSAGELLADLKRIGAAEGRGDAPRRPGRRTWAAVAAGSGVLIALGGIGAFRLLAPGGPVGSLAVLPFANAGGDPDAEYLSDGLTEGIINSLALIPQLKVIARASVFRYKGQDIDPGTVGRDLGVRAVLVGSVGHRRDDLMVSAELVDAEDRRHLWGGQYTRPVSDILKVQGEIAGHISESLRLRLTGDEKSRLAKRSAGSPEANRLYLQGRFFENKGTRDGFMKAVEYFQSAIAADSGYAPAYAGLAEAHYWVSNMYVSPTEAMPKSRAAATKALELDETLGEAHASLGRVKALYDWDWAGGGEEFRRAIALSPGSAEAHLAYGNHLAVMGDLDGALAEMATAGGLDPLSAVIGVQRALLLQAAGRDEQAAEEARRALHLEPSAAQARVVIGIVDLRQGRIEEGIAEIQRAFSLDDNADTGGWLGYYYAASGRRDDAMRLARRLETRQGQFVPAWSVAMIFAGMGDADRTFEWLAKACDDRSEGISWLKIEPRLKDLRSDPRYRDLLRRVGLASG